MQSASEVSTTPSSIDLSYSDISYNQSEIDMSMMKEEDNPTSRSDLDPEEPTSTSAPMVEEIEHDPIYFCENVIFKAEDRLFSVPKSGLVDHGTFFQTIFNQNLTDGHSIDAKGSSKNPITLDGVSKIDFHNFLRLIYPFRGVDPPSGDEHWLGILDLSTKWGFQEVRNEALVRLDHIFTSPSHNRDPIRALYLCIKYDIKQHIQHQYESLITSINPLDHRAMFDGGIDDDTIRQVMKMRDRWFCGYVWGGRGSGTGIGGILPTRVSAQRIVGEYLASLGHAACVCDSEIVEQSRRASEDSTLLNKVEELESLEKRLIEEAERREREEHQRREAERLDLEAADQEMAEEERLRLEAENEDREATQGTNANELQEQRGEQPEQQDQIDAEGECEVDNLDDIESVTSDMSVVPSPNIGPRVEKLIILRAQKWQLEKQIDELKARGVGDDNARMEKLVSVVDKLRRKLLKMWEKGTSMATYADSFDSENCTINLENHNEKKCGEKIEENLERMLHPDAKSLSFSIVVQGKKAMAQKQKNAVGEIRDYYGFLAYTTEDAINRKVSRTNIPEEQFGEWLAEFRRLASQPEVPSHDPWAWNVDGGLRMSIEDVDAGS